VLAVGLALRVVAIVSWWPTTIMLNDNYQLYANTTPFDDPLHPAGYGLILSVLGGVTREVALPVLVQHLTGFASALLLYAATRRLTGSSWAGLLPAIFVLLNPDEIYLEHAIMSESWSVLATSIGLYAAVRAFDEPAPAWRWPLLCGVALAVSVTIRTAGVLVIGVAVLALLLCRPQPLRRWREHWRAPVATAAAAAAILLGYAAANAYYGPRFWITSSPGWYAYSAASQFADCKRFTPPPGTRFLCDSRPASKRPGSYYYLFVDTATAPRRFGVFGKHDALIGSWSRRALRAQPGDFLSMTWEFIRTYWVPSSQPDRPAFGVGLDPQLDFTFDNPFYAPVSQRTLEVYYNDFTVRPKEGGLRFLRAWHLFTRFGATLLFISTVLVLIGLAIGTRRSRAGVLLFGVGGLVMVLPPAMSANYGGRYTVPMAGPMMAASAITLLALWRAWSGRPRRMRAKELAAG
jgi:4-amino-4-deoxy-L-arabinose transferase-like glycosyltransferase